MPSFVSNEIALEKEMRFFKLKSFKRPKQNQFVDKNGISTIPEIKKMHEIIR